MVKRIHGKILAIILTVAMAASLLPAMTPGARASDTAALKVTLGTASYDASAETYTFSNVTVAGSGIRTIFISFTDSVKSEDTITLPATTPEGFTVSPTCKSNKYSKRINVDTSVAGENDAVAVQSYLRAVTFTLGSTQQSVRFTVTTEYIEYDTFYNIDSQHYYQYIPFTDAYEKDWIDSYADAEASKFMGRQGYLATITNIDEDVFVNLLSGGKTGWLGGTRLQNTGHLNGDSGSLYYSGFSATATYDYWYWACGPEKNITVNGNPGEFFDNATSDSSAIYSRNEGKNYYFNWSYVGSLEPNNYQYSSGETFYQVGETCLTTLTGEGRQGYETKDTENYTWNDIPYNKTKHESDPYSAVGYFVEYGNSAVGGIGGSVSDYSMADAVIGSGTCAAKVNIKVNGSASAASGNIELRKGETTFSMTAGSTSGEYAVSLPVDSTKSTKYDVYANGLDTGTDVTVGADGTANSPTADLYTVSFSVSNAGLASGGTAISAAAGGMAINSGAQVPSGAEVVFTATGAGADAYTYTWKVDGSDDGETSNKLTISSLSGAKTAACTVTGLDKTAPDLPSFSPANGATKVALNVAPALTFQEALYSDASAAPMGTYPSGVVKVYKGANNSGTALGESDYTVAYNSTTHVFTVSFKADLDQNQSYYVELQAGKIYDEAGNGIDSVSGVTFKTALLTKLETPGSLAWDTTKPAKATWAAVDHAGSYTVQLYKGDTPCGSAVTGIKAASYDFTSAITEPGTYTFKVTAIGDKTNYSDSDTSSASAEVHSYTVTFDARDGSAVNSQTVLSGGKAEMPDTPSKTGYTFAGWYTDTGFSAPKAWDFSTKIVTGTMTLYANWTQLTTFTVTYSGNGSTSGSVPADSGAYTSGDTVTVKGNTGNLARQGNTFAGWNDGTTTYTAGQTFRLAGSVTLSAVWTPAAVSSCTVTYSGNYYGGGTSTAAVEYGSLIPEPEAPTRDGYIFSGWYKDSACVNICDFHTDTVTGNITLYAKWAENTYTVSGTVEDDQTPSNTIVGATVRVMQGNMQFGDAVLTNASGRFTITGIPCGTYDLIVTEGSQKVVICITIDGEDYDYEYTGEITLPTGNKNTAFEVKGADTPNAVVDKLNDVFGDSGVYTDDDRKKVDKGGTVEIKLTMQKNDNSAHKAKVEAAMTSSGYTSGIVMDVDMTKTVLSSNGAVLSKTAETAVSNLITIIIPLPSELQGKASYVVTRAHDYLNGKGTVADTITTTPNKAHEKIVVSSDKTQITLYAQYFSTYAIGYAAASGSGSGAAGYSITVSAGTGGSISPSGGYTVISGGSKTFTITPDEGYYISDVLVDGKSVGAVGSYTFSDAGANHTISAVFEKAVGLPYYIADGGNKVFIGFAAVSDSQMKYIAPEGETVLFKENSKSFTDIGGHWAKSCIDFVTQREIFVGTGSGLFSPDAGMTRAMFAAVTGRLYERSYGDIEAPGTHAFTDCDYSDYYGKYVDWAAQKGIIEGYGNGKFGPGDQVTREQMATILYRFAKFLDVLPEDIDTALGYPDARSISSWAENAALYCQSTDIITGRTGGYFAPQSTAARAEVSAILERFIENVVA